MRKILFRTILLFSIMIAGLFFTSSSKHSDIISVTGYIHSFGNEPLVFPGIITDDGKRYGVVASLETKKELLEQTGKHIDFTGVLVKSDLLPVESLEDGALQLHSWKVLKK